MVQNLEKFGIGAIKEHVFRYYDWLFIWHKKYNQKGCKTCTKDKFQIYYILKKKLNYEINELKQFKKLIVGYELQIIELKKEVDVFLRELGREEKYRNEIGYIENKADTDKPKMSQCKLT